QNDQELTGRDGLSAVTRYKPEADKVMRMHAQTAAIEDGRVLLPTEAPWLDDYLHELMLFPRGKYDDQVDSTSQFLDWRSTPMRGEGAYEYERRNYERLQAAGEIPVFETPKQEYAVGSVEWQAEQRRNGMG